MRKRIQEKREKKLENQRKAEVVQKVKYMRMYMYICGVKFNQPLYVYVCI